MSKDKKHTNKEEVEVEEVVNNTDNTAAEESVETENVADTDNNNEGDTTEVEDTNDAKDETKKAKKGFFKKKKSKTEELQEQLEESNIKTAEINDKYLRLYSEFDNFRKRTIKEKSDIYKTAGEDVIISIISIVDDFERALQNTEDNEENKAHREGLELIFSKFNKILESKNVKAIEAIGKEFDTDLHEAITQIPAPTEDMQGKVIDVVEKGYTMNDKVIRFSKVVIGATNE